MCSLQYILIVDVASIVWLTRRHLTNCRCAIPCDVVLAAGQRAPKGKQQAAQQQSLFLLYLDAVSVTNNKRAVQQGALPPPATAAGAQQQQQQQNQQQVLCALPPNVPDFNVRDLQFVLTFLGEEIAKPQQLGALYASACLHFSILGRI